MSSHTIVLAEAIEHLYSGQPWLDVTLLEHLQSITPEQALRRLNGCNNTWEIVNHLIFWHQNVMRKLRGENPDQEGDLPDFYLPENTNEENWQNTLKRLEHSVQLMADAMRNYPEEKLYGLVPNTQHSSYYYMQGVVEHAAYHLGQIVLLHKYATA
ncbi:DinB family protein [Chitinophaga horti]|uniref:DinB family protein n=1 Tax=Chitinophaga horti TaxID=2920382 RepID=A0ABY6J6A2_9BACT|nr:DinB family protein [Chitinophaga horti]UYQ95035.1 DinB family protein [Chitinophaga horti]